MLFLFCNLCSFVFSTCSQSFSTFAFLSGISQVAFSVKFLLNIDKKWFAANIPHFQPFWSLFDFLVDSFRSLASISSIYIQIIPIHLILKCHSRFAIFPRSFNYLADNLLELYKILNACILFEHKSKRGFVFVFPKNLFVVKNSLLDTRTESFCFFLCLVSSHSPHNQTATILAWYCRFFMQSRISSSTQV